MQNKVVLITGGSKGIGLGIAKTLVNEGYRVAITSRNLEEAKSVISNIGSINQIMAFEADVTNFTAQEDVVNQIIKVWGKLDVLIANAGVGGFAPIEDLEIDTWHQIINTNLTGVFYSVKACQMK